MHHALRHASPTRRPLQPQSHSFCPELERHPWLAKAFVVAGPVGCALEVAAPPMVVGRLILFVATLVVGLVYSLRRGRCSSAMQQVRRKASARDLVHRASTWNGRCRAT